MKSGSRVLLKGQNYDTMINSLASLVSQDFVSH